MIPNLLILGLVVGLFASRLRTVVLAVVALGAAWGIGIAAAGGLEDLLPAFAVGSANATLGAAVGAVLAGVVLCLAGRGSRRAAT